MASILYSFTELGDYIVGLTHYGYDKIAGADVAAGLETLYADVLGFAIGKSAIFAPHHPSVKSATQKSKRLAASLFLRWQSLYNGFTVIRREAWQLYWATLPFGGHNGANGYPGSGFSAFVYVNAPRLKAGLSLLLDPPFIAAHNFIIGFGVQEIDINNGSSDPNHFVYDFVAGPLDAGPSSIGFINNDNYLALTNVSVKVTAPFPGSELITNGNFATGFSPWVRISGHPRTTGGICYLTSGDIIVADCAIVDGWSYRMEFDWLAIPILP